MCSNCFKDNTPVHKLLGPFRERRCLCVACFDKQYTDDDRIEEFVECRAALHEIVLWWDRIVIGADQPEPRAMAVEAYGKIVDLLRANVKIIE